MISAKVQAGPPPPSPDLWKCQTCSSALPVSFFQAWIQQHIKGERGLALWGCQAHAACLPYKAVTSVKAAAVLGALSPVANAQAWLM